MAFHIVTSKCFLACEKVTSVIIEELIPERPTVRRRRKLKKRKSTKITTVPVPPVEPLQQFCITICYYPLGSGGNNNKNTSGFNSSNNTDEYTLELRLMGKKEANLLYAEIIREVQEQHPGEGYLDKLVNKMLSAEEFQIEEPKANVTI